MDPAHVPAPGARERPAHRAMGTGASRALPGHARPARRRRRAARHASRGDREADAGDCPSEDPAFAWEGRTAGQAPEIDGVVYLRDRSLTPGRFARIRIVEVEGYELVGERA